MRKNIVYFVITGVLLLATVIVSISGFRAARNIVKTDTVLSYNLQGSFSHQAYGYQDIDETVCISCGEVSDLIYFPTIIGDINCNYDYEFLSEEEISDINTQVQISAILNTSYWSKEMVILPYQEMTGTPVTFPLDGEGLIELVNKISQELGLISTSPISSADITLEAKVRTEATMNGKTITDNFTQSCDVSWGSTIVQWSRPLDLALKGYQSGIAYEQRGLFGYTIDLLPNTLFGDITMTSPVPAIKIPRKLDQSTSYRSGVIDNMNVSFDFDLVGDKPVAGINNTVKASAVLSSIDGTQAVFLLLDEQEYTNDFTLRLPIDVTLLYDVIKKIENTTANDFDATYTCQVKVDVHTTATEPGAINETISAVLPMKLTSGNLTVEAATGNAKTGTLTETVAVPNKTRSSLMAASLSLLCLTVVTGLLAGWSFWNRRRTFSPIYQLWETARQTMAKHKAIFVSVLEIPPAAENEKTTQLESLAELVKLSDSLLKPVLHQQDADRHIFCVIDGTSRYLYMIIEPPPA